MALKDGDVVRFDYTLWVEGTEKPMETSVEDVAKANGIHHDKRYRPLTVTLGAQQIIPGLESHIRSHGQPGKTVKVTLSPKEAFGEREASKVKDVPMGQFKAQKVQPQVGMSLNLQGSRGVVTRVAGGRVRVDLNHDLAGKTLVYEYTIKDVLQDESAKLAAVVENMFGPGVKVENTKDAVVFEVPDQVKFDQNWTMAKFRVISELRNAIGNKKAIRLVENYPVIPEQKDEPGHEGHGHGPGEHHH